MADKEYIEREKVLSVILGQYPEAHYPDWYAQDIREIPKADVVEVVRCEDCEYCREYMNFNMDKYHGCNCNGEIYKVTPTHFCGYGKRKGGK